jgi:hypothetical protein
VLVAVGLFVVVLLFLAVLVLVLIPLVVLIVGALVALLALGARLLSISSWTIRARGRTSTLTWWVRGLSRSGRAMQTVATMLAQGEEPEVEGRRGVLGG